MGGGDKAGVFAFGRPFGCQNFSEFSGIFTYFPNWQIWQNQKVLCLSEPLSFYAESLTIALAAVDGPGVFTFAMVSIERREAKRFGCFDKPVQSWFFGPKKI